MRTPWAAVLCLVPLLCFDSTGAAEDKPARVDVVVAQGMTDWDRINLERNLRWMLARERAPRIVEAGQSAAAGKRRVGVFADAGVWHVGARSIVDALEEKGIDCQVLDRTMVQAKGLDRFEAIILPGGWAPHQWGALGEPGLAAIRSYVERGGRCLGICAGAYLLSHTTQYDNDAFPYPLGLFDGTAKGPVEGLARYPKPGHARLSITAEGRARGLAVLSGEPLYYSGGPCFRGGTGIEVLARYHDDSPAAIRRKVGKGEIILIGAHPERPSPERGGDEAPPPPTAGKALAELLSLDK